MATLTQNPKDSEKIKNLLDKDLPSYRKAYSDRTAWLMACFSELAYTKFNPFLPDGKQKDYLVKQASRLAKLASKKKAVYLKEANLLKLIELVGYDHAKKKEELLLDLAVLKFELAETFDKNGTQAVLASNDKHLVLAFRGTEMTSIKDIKTDFKAKTKASESGGKVHTGFQDAFQEVAHAIQTTLNQERFKGKPLFITGHSLGGALATIAAKELTHESGIAACYTFGSPRVGNDVWASTIKTPIYRVVNAADGVTVMPPDGVWLDGARILFSLLPYIGKAIQSWLQKFAGYYHVGDMRYLSNCSRGNYGRVKLLYSVSAVYRAKGWYKAKKPLTGFLADHKIGIYRKKLMIIADRRNRA
ncbi:MAG: lipase family protein [Pirellulales bacterium]|nr:lipase family protein [Alphaproteobacteria bacterium]MDA8041096.1 lipase family protein [Pirellulales bacterium]